MNDIVEAEENAIFFKNFLNNPNDLNNFTTNKLNHF